MCNFTVHVQHTKRQRLSKHTMILKEQQQLRKIRKGDIDSYEKLFFSFYPGLLRYAEMLVRKTEIAEEIVQDVFYNI